MYSPYDSPSEILRKILRKQEGTSPSTVTDYPAAGTVAKLQEVINKLPADPATLPIGAELHLFGAY